MRKSIMLSAARLAKKMQRARDAGRGYFAKHIKAMLSYMGWFSCTDTYECYLQRIKPFIIRIGRLKKIVSKLDRRQNKHEAVDRGTQRTAACRVAACGA